MTRPLSPIERMVDAACGIAPEQALAPPRERYVLLRCPDCGRKQSALREKYDAPGAAVVEMACPKCIGDREEVPIRYLDTAGAEIEAPRAAEPQP